MKLLKQIVLILIILVAVGCLVSLAFLSEAQRMIVLVGGGFAILNLVFILEQRLISTAHSYEPIL